MAQAATMGPPLSPRETRRSGRRSAPSASTSASKSPDSEQPPRQKDKETTSARPTNSTASSNGRNKRLKQEDVEDSVDERRLTSAPSVTSTGSNQTVLNGKGKRKGKDKDKQSLQEEAAEDPQESAVDDGALVAAEEEEQGITRCVCGSAAEDDPDAGEFMVQCEGCKVWQHGLCMGYQTEDQVHDDDYYCEQCRPEMHVDLLRRLSNSRKGRNPQRVSRSHSPSHALKQPSKRRNTMNSRDANFDESLKEIIEATAAEAAAVNEPATAQQPEEITGVAEAEADTETLSNGKKKRKRGEDEIPAKKRTRSASATPDPQSAGLPRDETPVNGSVKAPSQAPAAKGGARNKRGGRKPAAETLADGEEAATPSTNTNKRQGGKKGGGGKRPPLSHAASQNSGTASQDHGGRRTVTNGSNGPHSSSNNSESRQYHHRNAHNYNNPHQPLLTSWGLPDYLAHLEHILPTGTPQPLEVRAGNSSGASNTRGESAELTMERGVKVKWPSKRMSVGDMNKRVRALVEWVGREQANALDRERRRDALEKVLKEQGPISASLVVDGDTVMAVDEPTPNEAPTENGAGPSQPQPQPEAVIALLNKESSSSTMKLMEELMEELIGFQEKFGPGAKTRERESRRQGNATSASS